MSFCFATLRNQKKIYTKNLISNSRYVKRKTDNYLLMRDNEMFLVVGVLGVEVGPAFGPVVGAVEGSYIRHGLKAVECAGGEGSAVEQRATRLRHVVGQVE